MVVYLKKTTQIAFFKKNKNLNLTWRWFETQTPHKHKGQSCGGLWLRFLVCGLEWNTPFHLLLLHYTVRKYASPGGSVGNGLRLCFGVAVALYLAQGRPLLRLKPAAALPLCQMLLMELDSVKRHTRRHGWSCFPNSSLRWLPVRERGCFLWPFASDRNTCFLLPVIAPLQRKLKEKSE